MIKDSGSRGPPRTSLPTLIKPGVDPCPRRRLGEARGRALPQSLGETLGPQTSSVTELPWLGRPWYITHTLHRAGARPWGRRDKQARLLAFLQPAVGSGRGAAINKKRTRMVCAESWPICPSPGSSPRCHTGLLVLMGSHGLLLKASGLPVLEEPSPTLLCLRLPAFFSPC